MMIKNLEYNVSIKTIKLEDEVKLGFRFENVPDKARNNIAFVIAETIHKITKNLKYLVPEKFNINERKEGMYKYDVEVIHKETGERRTKQGSIESNVIHDVVPMIMGDMGIDKDEMSEWNIGKFDFDG